MKRLINVILHRAVGLLLDHAGFFPSRGDVVEVVKGFHAMSRQCGGDTKLAWLEPNTQWFVVDCSWTIVPADGDALPATQGRMVLTSYGPRRGGCVLSCDPWKTQNAGYIEIFWMAGWPGQYGFLRFGSTGLFDSNGHPLPLGRYMKKILDGRRLKSARPGYRIGL